MRFGSLVISPNSSRLDLASLIAASAVLCLGGQFAGLEDRGRAAVQVPHLWANRSSAWAASSASKALKHQQLRDMMLPVALHGAVMQPVLLCYGAIRPPLSSTSALLT